MAGVELALVILASIAAVVAVAGAFAVYRDAARQGWGPPLAHPRRATAAGLTTLLAAMPLASVDVGVVPAVFLVLNAAMATAVALPYLALLRRRA
jgi:hypothetical protein